MKENQKITTCDELDLETPLGSRPIMHAQKRYGHWMWDM